MSNLSMSVSKVVLIVAISAIVLIGCSSKFTASMRKVTYPPDFKYTEPADLRSDMHQLAFQMGLLDKALVMPSVQTSNEVEIQRVEVLNVLRHMGRIANSLQAGNSGANHPYMDDYMQDLVAKIDEARIGASLQQPRYYFAGKVSGGCVNCHKANR
ncbi:MAG: hypothetical protein ACJAVV_001701 [Alphaproteobacteria bacterium]|jgi:hypothetical protein